MLSKHEPTKHENELRQNPSIGFQPMSIHMAAESMELVDKEDPFLHPCLKMMQHLCCCHGCSFPWLGKASLPPNDEDFVYHDLTMESTAMDHFQTLTRPSRILCLVLLVLALLQTTISSSSFLWTLFLIILLFAILYFVYWKKHRLDLSLNRVIHFFAMGTILAILWEMLEYILLDELFYYLSKANTKALPLIKCLGAFVVIGVGKEFLKYTGFTIIANEHRYLGKASSSRIPPDWEDCRALLASDNCNNGAPSVASSGAAITCAVIAVGLGFGWVENFVSIYHLDTWSANLVGQLSILPQCTILAAVQSIGICSRDLEQRPRSLIVLPAALMHGMAAYFLLQPTSYDGKAVPQLWDAVAVWTIVLLSYLYYVVFATQQQTRLLALGNHSVVLDDPDPDAAVPVNSSTTEETVVAT